MAAATAHAGPITYTVTGTFGTLNGNQGNAPFANGNTFSVSFTVLNSTPTFFDATRAFFGTSGDSYTNGSLTVFPSFNLVFTDPTAWVGQDFQLDATSVYTAGDFMEIGFAGTQLF